MVATGAVGLGILGIGGLLLSLADETSLYAGSLLPGLLVVGIGAGLVFAAVAGSAMVGIPHEHAGMASGFLMTGHEIGAALGVAAFAAIAGTAGKLTVASGVVDAYDRGSLAIAVAAAAFGVLAALWMPAGKAATGAMHLH